MKPSNVFLLMVAISLITFMVLLLIDRQAPNLQPTIVPPTKQKQQKLPTFDDAQRAISRKNLEKMERHLSETIGDRTVGTKGNYDAAVYIRSTLETFGMQTEIQEFVYRGQKTHNIFGWLEGQDKNKVVVFGAHMDTYHNPGADDNASGVVVVLEVAKSFSVMRGQLKKTIVFQLYSAEEEGLVGSAYYCRHPTFPKEHPAIANHVYMLNADMVGHYRSGMSFLNNGNGASDQASFQRANVNIGWLFTGMHKDYHKITDTSNTINYDGLEIVARFAFDHLWGVVQGYERVDFYNVPKIDMRKDHGVRWFD
jgi:Zn-dependent M28 family amino/carboxypeptidase